MKISVTEASLIRGCDFSKQDSTGGYNDNFCLIDDTILQWDYIPGEGYRDDPKEYIEYQYDLDFEKERHRGITSGCVWTDWE